MAETANELTIEQLAQETGMSVRNIRNHQSRGLLPPPDVRSRIGYYGPDHVTRLRLVQEMQAEGFNLAAISRLVGGSRGAADRLLGFALVWLALVAVTVDRLRASAPPAAVPPARYAGTRTG